MNETSLLKIVLHQGKESSMNGMGMRERERLNERRVYSCINVAKKYRFLSR